MHLFTLVIWAVPSDAGSEVERVVGDHVVLRIEPKLAACTISSVLSP